VDFDALVRRAVDVRSRYVRLEQKIYGRAWTKEEVALGFVGDVGDLMKLILAHGGVRHIPDADRKLAHELADCLWSLLVLAQMCEVDLEEAFFQTMDELENHIAARLAE
jgi:NTP pyrophosphatase (non-canonical NTP hydrolase)